MNTNVLDYEKNKARYSIFKNVYMKNLKTKKTLKAFLVVACLFIALFIGLLISINFIVDPIVYWLASTEVARIFISCILSWLGVSTLFDLYYKNYKRRKKIERFNALNVPYPRTFRGRKWSQRKLLMPLTMNLKLD